MELTDQEKRQAEQTDRIAQSIANAMQGQYLEELRGQLSDEEIAEVLAIASILFEGVRGMNTTPRMICYGLGAAASMYAEAYGLMKNVEPRPRPVARRQ